MIVNLGEKVWFALPVIGLLSQLGGTYKKQWRRIGIPTVMALVAILTFGFSNILWIAAMFGAIFAATTLPFTLKGDSLYDHWINWAWLPVWSILISVSGFPLLLANNQWLLFLIAAGFCSTFICIISVLSNTKVSRDVFVWKFCEFMIWTLAMSPTLLLIQ